MPNYQRVQVRPISLHGSLYWRRACRACEDWCRDFSRRESALKSAVNHFRTCPALRLQRLLADLEAFARSSEVLSGECRAEATKYSGDPEFTHWQTWSYAHHAYATHVTHFVEKYREAPDA